MIKNRNEIEAEQRYAQTMARIAGNVRRSLTLDRRGFVKGSFAVGLFAALGAGLAGCAPGGGSDESAKAAAAFTPGSYAATGTGRNAEISITCTFDEGKLTDIAYEEDESRNIGDEACRMLKERYLAAQNLNVDSISGATMTSMAFSAAVADCWKQAGGDVSKAQKAASALPAAEAVEETCDVCVVGSGGAALAAAVSAAEAGASVVVLEKMDIVGGNTNAGEGVYNAPDPERQGPLGIEDSTDLYYQQTYEGGDEQGDPELVRILADNALDGLHWMEDHGLELVDDVYTAIGGMWRRGHEVDVERKGEQGGSYFVSVLRESAEKLGARIYTDAKVDKIVESGGAVTGVEGARPSSGAPVSVKAKSVVLGTGGYGRNAELAMQYDGRVTKTMPSSNVASSTGDIIPVAQQVGAGLRNMELVQIHPLGDPQNGGVATFVGNWMSIENFVFVNENGERFIREDERRDVISNAELEQPNQEMWLIVDSTDVESDRLDQIAELVETGHSFQAESVEDLAKQIAVPADTLKTTIDGYNACCEAGVDTQITPGKELLGTPIDDAPLYASKRCPTIHYTMGGVRINADAQVCTDAGEPIANLYAAGECTGGVQGANRLGANSYPDLIVFGRIAGASAAANATA